MANQYEYTSDVDEGDGTLADREVIAIDRAGNRFGGAVPAFANGYYRCVIYPTN